MRQATADMRAKLLEFVARDLLGGQGDDLTDTTPLLELGVLDSFSTIKLLSFVEKELGIAVPMETISPNCLKDIATFVNFLTR